MREYAGSDLEEAAALVALLFDLLNRSLFDGKLPPPALEIAGLRTRLHDKVLGVFLKPGESGRTEPTICIDPYEADALAIRSDLDTWTYAMCETLAHEMIHYYCYLNGIDDCEDDYHTEVFKNKSIAHRLDCAKGDNGWSITSISDKGWIFIFSKLDIETARSLGWEYMI